MPSFATTGWRRKVLAAGFLVLTLAVILSVVITNWSSFRQYQWDLRPIWLGYAFAFLLVALFLSSYVWHLIVVRFTKQVSLRHNLKYWGQANLAKRLPGPIWYIGSRAVLYEEKGVTKLTTSFLSGLELTFIVLSGIATFLLTLPFWALPAELVDDLRDARLLVLLAPLLLLLAHPSVLNWLRRKLIHHHPLQELQWRDTISWFIFYIIIWVVGACMLFSVISFLHPIAPSQLMAVIGIWAAANTVSLLGTLTITGIGLREISLTLLLITLMPSPVALMVAVLVRLMWMSGEFAGAVVSLLL